MLSIKVFSIIYLLPLIIDIILLIIYEFLCKRVARIDCSAKPISQLVFIPLLNWILIPIIPIGIIIFGSEYLSRKLNNYL